MTFSKLYWIIDKVMAIPVPDICILVATILMHMIVNVWRVTPLIASVAEILGRNYITNVQMHHDCGKVDIDITTIV